MREAFSYVPLDYSARGGSHPDTVCQEHGLRPLKGHGSCSCIGMGSAVLIVPHRAMVRVRSIVQINSGSWPLLVTKVAEPM
jgi:hypothetical protein